MRPFFTADEIEAAIAGGISPDHFPNPAGTQVELVPHPVDEGYICPAFDPATSHCQIYNARPLDCRLYPFALMWDATHAQVVLGWDTKCPYMRDLSSPVINQAAHEVAQLMEEDGTVAILARYPRLIGKFQDDVIVVRPLERVTEQMRRGSAAVTTQPLTLQDRGRFETALSLSADSHTMPLAAASFAYHYIWRQVLSYSWAVLRDGHLSVCRFF